MLHIDKEFTLIPLRISFIVVACLFAYFSFQSLVFLELKLNYAPQQVYLCMRTAWWRKNTRTYTYNPSTILFTLFIRLISAPFEFDFFFSSSSAFLLLLFHFALKMCFSLYYVFCLHQRNIRVSFFVFATSSSSPIDCALSPHFAIIMRLNCSRWWCWEKEILEEKKREREGARETQREWLRLCRCAPGAKLLFSLIIHGALNFIAVHKVLFDGNHRANRRRFTFLF